VQHLTQKASQIGISGRNIIFRFYKTVFRNQEKYS